MLNVTLHPNKGRQFSICSSWTESEEHKWLYRRGALKITRCMTRPPPTDRGEHEVLALKHWQHMEQKHWHHYPRGSMCTKTKQQQRGLRKDTDVYAAEQSFWLWFIKPVSPSHTLPRKHAHLCIILIPLVRWKSWRIPQYVLQKCNSCWSVG